MARITRKELKSDRFAVEVGHTFSYVEGHKREVIRYGLIALGVLAIAFFVSFFLRQRQATRRADLAGALRVLDATVGPAADSPGISYPTQDVKHKEVAKAFTDVMTKHSGSQEGAIAAYFLGCKAVDDGKMAEAGKLFKQAADAGDKKYAPLAKLSLGQMYISTGRTTEGEKLLRDLIASPSVFVSKDTATIALARSLAKSNPQEARKLLEPLASEPGAGGQVAISLMGELFAAK